ncbi:hypothetical protein [Paenirhodobacter populi]|uniref:Flagellar FliJ protein n=1 Tax=Paenirhodobacter populi TaxID=2306993 RepID=A0A443J3P2_9RHOB|nr:hypothetical protein [Sinirhodobacter populi]RWR14933.1 hypothetical protein D2T33_03015 [Sinirhodobacter populi]
MTRHGKLAALDGIARMKRELELAELARLNARKRELAREREALQRQTAEALRAGTDAPAVALAAERFGRWTHARTAAIAVQEHRIDDAAAAQKDRAAQAVGRHHVLERIVARLRRDDARMRP